MKNNFAITSNLPISESLKSIGIYDFKNAGIWVKNLPYKRNYDKQNSLCILHDYGGTCSTKHAFLKNLAIENGFDQLKLLLGIFRMNKRNTPKIAHVLDKYKLSEIPEAHNYLKLNHKIFDYTHKNSKKNDFIYDLIKEVEIPPEQIYEYKIEYHKKFLEKYLSENHLISYNLNTFWNIREECITALQK